MDTKIYNKETIKAAAALLQAGELVAFPTETVYGLGADATNELAVKQVYLAKGRPSDNPLIVHVKAVADVLLYVDNFSAKAKLLSDKFWPGPLTLVFNVKKGTLPVTVTGELSTVAFRMPNNALTLQLIKEAGVPLVGPSANTSGKPSPTKAEHVFHDLAGKIAGIVDDGQTDLGIESTVLDLTSEVPVILRPGAITKLALEAVVGPVEIDSGLVDRHTSPKSPGMKYKHYAPEAEVKMIDWQKNNWQEAIEWAQTAHLSVALLASQEIIDQYQQPGLMSYVLSETEEIEQASRELFSGLRALDQQPQAVALIFAQTYPETGKGLAYMNRLKKAANNNYFE